MRLENFNPNRYDAEFENVAIERLVEAGEVVASAARRKCPVGTISRPMYKSGPYAGQAWTARDAGQLKRSIRTARKKTKSGKAFSRKRDIRIIAGGKLPFYARIVEHSKPFLRPALAQSIPAIKSIIGVR